MWKWMLVCLVMPALAADDARLSLISSLKNDAAFEDPLRAVMIVETNDVVEAERQVAALRVWLEGVKLAPKDAGRRDKKKAKALLSALNDSVDLVDTEPGLAKLLSENIVGRLGHAWLLGTLAQREDLNAEALESLGNDVHAYLRAGEARGQAELLAAYLVRRAFDAAPEDGAFRYAALRISHQLAPTSEFGKGTLDRELFNKALALYQGEQYEAAGYVAAGGAVRFPHIEQYAALSYNAGVMIMKGATDRESRQRVRPLLNFIAPHTGENREVYQQGLTTLAYNDAVDYYNDGKPQAALDLLLGIDNPPDPNTYRALVRDSYTALIQNKIEAGEDHSELLAALKTFDAERAQEIATRLDQMKLQQLDQAGDYQAALEQAKKNLDAPNGEANYMAVLVDYVTDMQAQERFNEALDLLSRVPPQLVQTETVQNLRFNTYNNWLASLPAEDYTNKLPIYQRVFADRALSLTDADRAAFSNNYGNQYFFKVRDLIANNEFQTADTVLKQAMARFPQHKALVEIRANLDKILARMDE